MEKYSGNQKGFIYASCDAKDREAVFEKYLGPVAESGVSFCWGDAFDKKEEDNIAKSNAVLLFLTKDYARDDRLRKTVEAAVRNDKPILTVYLENVDLDAGLSMQLESQQALFRSKFKSDEEFAEELKKAAIFDKIEVTEQQKKKQKGRSIIAIAAAVIAVLVLAILIKPLLGPKANEETMEALGLQGLSKSELESIEELHIVGTEVADRGVQAYYAGGGTADIEYYYRGGAGDRFTTTAGSISDLNGMQQLRNLKDLELEGQQIEDVSPLAKLSKLEQLSLNCNPVRSLDGLEKLSNLRILDITDTNVTELPAGLHVRELYAENSGLRAVPDFGGNSNVYFNGDEFSDYANLSTAASYSFLRMEARNGLESQIIESLKGITIRFFLVSGLQIDSLEDLSELTITEELNIPHSSLTSLDGIEHFEGIKWIDLKYDTGLTDLSPLNRLESLEKVTLSDELAPLAGVIDEGIQVEYRND